MKGIGRQRCNVERKKYTTTNVWKLEIFPILNLIKTTPINGKFLNQGLVLNIICKRNRNTKKQRENIIMSRQSRTVLGRR